MKERVASPEVPVKRLALTQREAVLQRLRQRFAHIPAGVSLADELISERRSESLREDKANSL